MNDVETTLKNLFNVIDGQYNSGKIQFVESGANTVLQQIVDLYQAITKRTIARGDPVRLFLNCIAYVIIAQRNGINYAGRMNLLRYATANYLDEIGKMVDVARLEAEKATTTIKITLSKAADSPTNINAGIRVTAGDNVFFALKNDVLIPVGETTATAVAECLTAGDIGNGYLPGQLNTIVDRLPFTAKFENIDTSEGGADIESDESFRQRIHIAPESFSVAGPDGAYEYWAKTASVLIADVEAISPTPGDVKIYAILQNGELPGQEILDAILAKCNAKDKRPLTDHVSVSSPDVVNYDVNITFYISKTNATQASSIQDNVKKVVSNWIIWTKSKLGRDINPSELIKRMVVAGAKRVEIVSPAFTKVLNGDYHLETNSVDTVQIAVANDNPTINYGGLEDD